MECFREISRMVPVLVDRSEVLFEQTQVLLGKGSVNRRVYRYNNDPASRFQGKSVRLLSVFLFLACVTSGAVYSGIYYTYTWKPCTKKFFYQRSENASCSKQADLLGFYFKPTEETKPIHRKCSNSARVRYRARKPYCRYI